MHNEYAIDPTLINGYDRFRALIDSSCGWELGRVVTLYPRRWKRLVYDACASCKPVEKQRIEERLRRATYFVSRDGAISPSGDATWLNNALREHAREPFKAIIADQYGDGDQVLDGTLVNNDDKHWQPQSGIKARDPESLSAAVRLLLQNSSRILLIDPHFDPGKLRFRKNLRALLVAATGHGYKRSPKDAEESEAVRLELHCLSKPPKGDAASPRDYAQRRRRVAESCLPGEVPAGHVLHVRIWGCRVDGSSGQEVGERFHNRYVLSDLGGISFGTGLDVSNLGDTDDLARLSTEDAKARLQQFSEEDPKFERLESFLIRGPGR